MPLYNLVPAPGLPAQFGFVIYGSRIYIDASVRSGGDYGITLHSNNIPQQQVMGNSITFWGEPSNPSHNDERFTNYGDHEECKDGCASAAPHTPFLTLPTSCAGPQATLSQLDTWETAGFGESTYESHDSNDMPLGYTGCDHLQFGPSLSASPDTNNADTPAGLTVDVRVPQEGLSLSGALSMSNIRDTTVVLPKGVVINPGQAAGLQACQAGDVPGGDDLPLPGEDGEEERFSGPPDCPNSSKVGTLQIAVPLLKNTLEGDVYVLQSNPPNLKLLLAASGEGVNIKLVGNVSLCEKEGEVIDGRTCEAAGQIITKLPETPEAPFTDFKLAFSGGPQAALATPTECGTYTTTSDFTPWSAPSVGDAFPTSSFTIDSGSDGSACPPTPLPFSPSMIAGSTTDQAGGYTSFSLLLQSRRRPAADLKAPVQGPGGSCGDDLQGPAVSGTAGRAGDVPGVLADRAHGRRVGSGALSAGRAPAGAAAGADLPDRPL